MVVELMVLKRRAQHFDDILFAYGGGGSVTWPLHQEAQLTLRAQQRLDRAAFVHRTVAFRHLIKRQGQVEHLAGFDLSHRFSAFAHRLH